jgi:hypothetical protein
LAGTYGFVFEESPFESGQREDRDNLHIKFHGRAAPALKNLRGSMEVGCVKAEFTRVRRVGEKMKNAWKIDVKWIEGEEDELEGEGHRLSVLKAVDDNGNRLLEFEWYQGYMGCAPTYALYIAKKQTSSGTGLSKSEQEALGIGLSEAEVKKRALREEDSAEGGSEDGTVKSEDGDVDADESGEGDGTVKSEEGDVDAGASAAGASRKRQAPDVDEEERKPKVLKTT